MKKMKRILAVLVALCMMVGMVNLSTLVDAAASTAAGTYVDPHVVTVGGESTTFNLLDYSQDNGYAAYVVPSTADLTDEASTLPNDFTSVTVRVESTGTNWFVQYGRSSVYPTGGVAEFTMEAQNYEFFSVTNNDSENSIAVTVTMTAVAGGGSTEPTGTYEDPIAVELQDRGWAVMGSAEAELTAGSNGVYFKLVAPADGVFDIGPGASNYEFMYSVENKTQGKYGDYHWSNESATDDEARGCYSYVSQGDEVLVWVNSYNPEDEWNAPADTVYLYAYFYPMGSAYCPMAPENGEYSIVFEAGDEAYYFEYVATETGTFTVEMLSENWGYFAEISFADTTKEQVYGEYYYSNATTPVTSKSFEMVAGDKVLVFVMSFDPTNPYAYSLPAGTVKVGFNFISEATKAIVEEIKAEEEGGAYEIEVTEDNTVVAAEIIEAAKENGVDLEIVAVGYKWDIKAEDIGNDVAAIDFEVAFHEYSIVPIALVDALEKEEYGTFSLMHEGEFGLKATLTLLVDEEFAGKLATLYYYDEANNRLVEEGTCDVAVDGTVQFVFEHASDYVLTVKEKPAPAPAPTPTPTPTPAPDLGEYNMLVMYGMFILAGAGLFVLRKKVR